MAHVHEVTRTDARQTTVLHTGGVYRGSEHLVVEEALRRRPGVLAVDPNPAAQTATVTFDPGVTTVAELARWVEECGYHCNGRSVPGHICDPLAAAEPLAPIRDHAGEQRAEDAHGHGGHAGMSMDAMARDMRNRFLVAALFAIPIALWSPLGEFLFGSRPPAPFGMGDDLWQFLLSLPVVFYSSWIFFRGAWYALKARTLDMMVLVAVAIGTGWIYSVAATFWIEGYNSLAVPIAAGVFEPFGLTLRPEIAAISMSGSSVLVAVNAVSLKRLRLPTARG
jgi:P-type Cu2+ transporter